ncbi:MAG: enoyl-CoA hydratase [Dehalococcoidia bacterium]
MAETILLDKRSDGIALITLNRPDSLNALNGELSRELSEALADCDGDPAVRCIALTGAGRAFCAGGDVKSMRERTLQEGAGPDGTFRLENAVNGLKQRQWQISGVLHTMSKPTVAIVNGFAVGAGMSIALACDLRVCSDRARFGTAFRGVGLSGDYGGSYFLPRLIGAGLARELYFTGEVIDAERARELGIANRVVPHDDLMEEALTFCATLAGGPTRALGRMKANLNLSEQGATLEDVLAQEALTMRFSGQDDDHRNAAHAFVEKRQPVFEGR